MCPEQQLSEDPECFSCLVPLVYSDSLFDPQVETCPMHRLPVHTEDFSWLLKVIVVPEIFPTLQSLASGVRNVPVHSGFLQSDKFPIVMARNWRQFVATVSQGKSQTLKPPDSDVSLTIPDGVYTILEGCVHTDHSRFVIAIPADECIISPMVEFHHHPLHDEEAENTTEQRYTIKIPHCIPHKSRWRYIKVRKGDISKKEEFIEIKRGRQAEKEKTSYDIGEHFITIHTTHFTDFTCTICKDTFCSDLAMVFLFGSLRPLEDSTVVKVQPFLCSFLYVIEDYKQVVSGFC